MKKRKKNLKKRDIDNLQNIQRNTKKNNSEHHIRTKKKTRELMIMKGNTAHYLAIRAFFLLLAVTPPFPLK